MSAYKIDDKCINCGACVSECPVEAIKPGAKFHEISEELCVDCGACVPSCPVDAIVSK